MVFKLWNALESSRGLVKDTLLAACSEFLIQCQAGLENLHLYRLAVTAALRLHFENPELNCVLLECKGMHLLCFIYTV